MYNECFKLFINDDFGIYKNLFEKIDSMKNIWDKIDFIFSNISILEKAIIVIDSYNSDFDEGFMNLKLLSNKFPNFKFIICLDESDKYSKEICLDYFFPEKEKKIYSNILIIDNLLYSIENTVNTNKNLYKLFSLFNFIPQYYYDFLNLFPSNDAKEIKENIQKFLSLKIDEFQKCLKKILKQNRLCEIYKQFHYDIINKNELNISKLYEIFDYIPLEYINIKKVNNNSFVIEYAFPLLNKMKIINPLKFDNINYIKDIEGDNNLNKRCEIGNIFDDIVNSKFNLNNEIFGLKIDISMNKKI